MVRLLGNITVSAGSVDGPIVRCATDSGKSGAETRPERARPGTKAGSGHGELLVDPLDHRCDPLPDPDAHRG